MNQELVIDITGLTHQGEGVGRLPDGQAVFVPGTVPGEKAMVEIYQRKKKYARAKLLHIVEQARDRCQPRCNTFNSCGGCSLQHINYYAQLEHKTQLVKDNLSRIGKLSDVQVSNTLGMDYPWHYRNKVHFHVQMDNNRVTLGYFEQGSHSFITLLPHHCLLIDKGLNETAKTVEELLNKYNLLAYDWKHKRGLVRNIMLRKGSATGEIMVVIITSGGKWVGEHDFALELNKVHPQVVSVMKNINKGSNRLIMGGETINLFGKSTITEYLGSLKFDISANSFLQVNPEQTVKLYDKAAEYAGLTSKESVLDAYCGIGTIALYLAPRAKEMLGLEVVPQAVTDAKNNAQINGIKNVQFHQGEVERLLPLLKNEGYCPDVVILDPPRRGCGQEALDALIEMKAPKIVYISCDPSTLARDLAYLSPGGYIVKEVQPVDMFPHTGHVESVALMSRV